MSRPGGGGRRALLGLALVGLAGGPVCGQSALEFPFEAVPLRGLKAEVATVIVGDGEGGALRLATAALPEVGLTLGETGEGVVVPLLLEVEGVELFPVQEEGTSHGDLELYLYAIDAAGSVAGYLSQLLRLDLERFGEVIYEEGIKFVGHLRLPPGSYRLRMLVREPRSGRFGVRTLPVTVPASGEEALRLSVPMIADPGAGWVLARASRRGQTADVEGVGFESYVDRLQIGEPGRLAAALPILRSGAGASATVLGRLPTGVDWEVELTPRGGERRVSAPVTDAEQQPESGLDRITLRFGVPDLEPGPYTVRVIASGSDRRQRLVSPALEGMILPDLESTAELNWTHLRQLISEQMGTGTEVELPRGRRRDRKLVDPEVRDAYREVLERLVTSGSVEVALEELVEREQALFALDPTTALERITQTELAVGRAIGEAGPEGLLPLVLLHMRAYREHRERRNFALATHARSVAEALALRYAQLLKEGGAAETASLALTCIAADMVEGRLWKQSETLLARAVELDELNGVAMLMLASSRERFGDYAKVVELTRQVVAIDSKAPEARLRLGINLVRIGRERDAERTLDQLARERTVEWVSTLAHQELARLLLVQERTAEAASLLRRGVARLPRQSRLYLQLAFVLERLGQPRESAQVLRRLPINGGERSPRHAYSRAATDAVAPLWTSLEQRVNVRMPLLVEALSEAGR